MSETVMRKHIELYVNEYTKSLGEEGRQAIEILKQQTG
jgi:1,4-dihydroxy-6-naphthoate synthase